MENHNGFVPLNLILIFIGQTYSLIFLPESKIEYDTPLCADNTHIIKFGFDWCLKVKSVLIVGQSQSCDESVYCLLHECLENQGWNGFGRWLNWHWIAHIIKTAHSNHFCHSCSFYFIHRQLMKLLTGSHGSVSILLVSSTQYQYNYLYTMGIRIFYHTNFLVIKKHFKVIYKL